MVGTMVLVLDAFGILKQASADVRVAMGSFTPVATIVVEWGPFRSTSTGTSSHYFLE